MLVPGIYMHFAFFTGIDRNAGILVPGGILTTYGALFYANVFFGWHIMADLWPMFLIGIAVGLFELYLFGNHDKGLLVPVAILGGVGLSALLRTFISFDFKDYLVPVILIIRCDHNHKEGYQEQRIKNRPGRNWLCFREAPALRDR
jgi:hypothetical protein